MRVLEVAYASIVDYTGGPQVRGRNLTRYEMPDGPATIADRVVEDVRREIVEGLVLANGKHYTAFRRIEGHWFFFDSVEPKPVYHTTERVALVLRTHLGNPSSHVYAMENPPDLPRQRDMVPSDPAAPDTGGPLTYVVRFTAVATFATIGE